MTNIRAHFDAHRGLRYRVAKELGLTHGAVSQWLRDGNKIPAERVPAVSKITGLSLADLRPDLFGDQQATSERQ